MQDIAELVYCKRALHRALDQFGPLLNNEKLSVRGFSQILAHLIDRPQVYRELMAQIEANPLTHFTDD